MSMSTAATQHAPYASIMVPLDLGIEAEDRVRFAASLADRFSSRLIGVAAEEMFLPLYGTDGAVGVDARVFEIEEVRVRDDLARAEEVFRRAAGARNAVEWRSAIGMPRLFVAEQARAVDLVVVSRHGPDDAGHGRMGLDPGDLAMDLGRPMLLAPPRPAPLSARRVVIAWKNTREARRAVWDGLPFLKGADAVFVATVDKDTDREGAADVCEHLKRHGIAARAVVRPEPGGSTAYALLCVAEDEDADLIVCGAYGHSRLREWAFGGVTRDLLDASPVCCLMTH